MMAKLEADQGFQDDDPTLQGAIRSVLDRLFTSTVQEFPADERPQMEQDDASALKRKAEPDPAGDDEFPLDWNQDGMVDY